VALIRLGRALRPFLINWLIVGITNVYCNIGSMVILSGSSNLPLATKLAKELGVPRVKREIGKFPNGETKLRLLEDIKDQTVVIIQSLQTPVNDYLIELLLLADAARRAGAKKIISVIPWLGYSKQDKVFSPGEPLSAAVVARAISSAPIDKVFLMELHNLKEAEFFTLPTRHISFIDGFVDELSDKVNENSVVVSPDTGGNPRSDEFAKRLGLSVIYIDKKRHLVTGEVKALGTTGSTVVADSKYLRQHWAKSVTFCATHGIFARGFSIFTGGEVDKIIISDTIPVPPVTTATSNVVPAFVKVISASKTIARALRDEGLLV